MNFLTYFKVFMLVFSVCMTVLSLEDTPNGLSHYKIVKQFALWLNTIEQGISIDSIMNPNNRKQNLLEIPSSSLVSVYGRIDQEDISQFPPKTVIIESLKQGPCSRLFEYTLETFYQHYALMHKEESDRFIDLQTNNMLRTVGQNLLNRTQSEQFGCNILAQFYESHGKDPSYEKTKESFGTDYDGYIYFFYSLSQLKNPAHWELALNVLVASTYDKERDCGGVCPRNPYDVHIFFQGMANALEYFDASLIRDTMIQNCIYFTEKLANKFNTIDDVIYAFNSLLRLDEEGECNEFDVFIRTPQISAIICDKGGSTLQKILEIYALTEAKLDSNDELPSLWWTKLKSGRIEDAIKLKEFINKNYKSFFCTQS